MTSTYRRDRIKSVRNDEFEALTEAGRMSIIDATNLFVLDVTTGITQLPSAGEVTALRRAMARFLIDSGIAGARGWI